jgi:mono/diheme cytochrome c family protein
MSFASTVLVFATVYRTIGFVLFLVVLAGVVAYALVNVLFAGKPELGAEIELAANRKPYYPDEILEGPKLDRALSVGLLTLMILAIGVPLYWIMEPARQENAAVNFREHFESRGEAMFGPTGSDPQALNCAGCHGNLEGGVVPNYPLVDPATDLVTPVDWQAPALGTVLLRYSREEVRFILTYGRPGSPMPAWGVAGGGPLNDQQIQNLIDYLDLNQADPAAANAEMVDHLDAYLAAEFEDGGRVFTGPNAEGEALFNMGLLDGFAGGAFGCARCHTAGWSYAERPLAFDDAGTPLTGPDGQILVDREAFEEITANTGCGGEFGFNLCDGDTERQFPTVESPTEGDSPVQDMIDFITDGSSNGRGYGRRGQGSGKMPGFGVRPAEPAVYWLNGGAPRDPGPGLLTIDQIESIVDYERTLTSSEARGSAQP